MQALEAEDMRAGLGRLGVSASGSSFVFLEFQATVRSPPPPPHVTHTTQGAGLTSVELLRQYVHLQAIDLAHNNITSACAPCFAPPGQCFQRWLRWPR